VKIIEDSSDKTFEKYLKLTKETRKDKISTLTVEQYHRLMWETLKNPKSQWANRSLI